jgi:outer membrane lipoprotein-sorting protein
MEPFESSESLESRLKSLPLLAPAAKFGRPESLAAVERSSRRITLVAKAKTMNWKSKSAAAAVLAASAIAICVVTGGSTGSSLAFAQVAEKLRAARTLTFDSTLVSKADGSLISKNHNYYMVPGKTRTEMSDGKDESGYVVFDTTAAKALMVDSKRKTARVSEIKGGQGKDMAAGTIEDLQKLSAEEARPLGDKVVDGVAAKGFEVSRASDVTTVWADAATGAPVRIEILQNNFPSGPVVQTWTNIKFDVPLEAALFSVEPPMGLQPQPFLPVDFNMTPADFTAKFLKIYANHMDGQLPPRLQDAITLLSEKIKPKDANTPASEEAMQAAFYGAGMAAVVIHGQQGKDWEYYPGIKSGEKDKLVFWLHDKRKGGYLAVYGDLRVEPIAKLPAVEK